MEAIELAFEVEELEPMSAPSDLGDFLLGVAVGVAIGIILL